MKNQLANQIFDVRGAISLIVIQKRNKDDE